MNDHTTEDLSSLVGMKEKPCICFLMIWEQVWDFCNCYNSIPGSHLVQCWKMNYISNSVFLPFGIIFLELLCCILVRSCDVDDRGATYSTTFTITVFDCCTGYWSPTESTLRHLHWIAICIMSCNSLSANLPKCTGHCVDLVNEWLKQNQLGPEQGVWLPSLILASV